MMMLITMAVKMTCLKTVQFGTHNYPVLHIALHGLLCVVAMENCLVHIRLLFHFYELTFLNEVANTLIFACEMCMHICACTPV
jgi:hypothetical protein